MGSLELREKLHQYINKADERVLRIMTAVFESYTNTEESVVAYSVKGEPLSKEEYLKRIKAADRAIDEGAFTTTEDLEKEIENW